MSGRSPEQIAWMNMIARCANVDDARYGGRGISVCERWRESFYAFLADVGSRPSREHSLDRIDGDGNYEPGNVRWATEREQQRNRSTNREITVRGRTMCLAAWAEESGVKRETIAQRLRAGLSPERAIDPAPVFRKHLFRGRERSVREIAKLVSIPENSLQRRLVRHGSIEAAIAAWRTNGQGKKPAQPIPPSDVA